MFYYYLLSYTETSFDKSYQNTTKKYRKTPHGLKSHRKSEWKTKGKIKFYDFDKTYDKYINLKNCELCNIEFNDKIKKIMDHDHLSGYNRFICCNKCNVRLGVVDRHKLVYLLEIHRYNLNSNN